MGNNVPNHEEVQPTGMRDIRFYLTKDGKSNTIHACNQHSSLLEDQVVMEKVDKMKMIRGKMMMSRKQRENQETRNAILIRKRKEGNLPQFINKEGVVYAKDVHNSKVQDDVEVVIIGADVEALYPVLPWRTEGVSGVRPGVTANPEKEEN